MRRLSDQKILVYDPSLRGCRQPGNRPTIESWETGTTGRGGLLNALGIGEVRQSASRAGIQHLYDAGPTRGAFGFELPNAIADVEIGSRLFG